MVRSRTRTFTVLCLAFPILLCVLPALKAFDKPSADPFASGLCQMEYVNTVIDGRVGYEVVTITLGLEGGRLGNFYFAPGDIVLKVGEREVIPGENLDHLIRLALLENTRTVVLYDATTGGTFTVNF